MRKFNSKCVSLARELVYGIASSLTLESAECGARCMMVRVLVESAPIIPSGRR